MFAALLTPPRSLIRSTIISWIGLTLVALKFARSEITYRSLMCDNFGNCPTWTYCGPLRTTCLPCVRCGESSDSLTSNDCLHPARCLQSARLQSTSAFFTCPRLSITNGRRCQGVCQPHAIFNGGSPLGTQCLLQCGGDVMVNMVVSCQWDTRQAKAVWNGTLPEGFVAEASDNSRNPSQSLSDYTTVRSIGYNTTEAGRMTSLTGFVNPVAPTDISSQNIAVIIASCTLLIVLLLVAVRFIVRQFHCKELCEKVTLNFKLQLTSSTQTNNRSEEQNIEDSNVPVCVPVNKFQLRAEEHCYDSSENVTTLPTNTTPSEPSEHPESSGRWTQQSEQSILLALSRDDSITQFDEDDVTSHRHPLPGESEYDDDDVGANTSRMTSRMTLEPYTVNDTQPKTLNEIADDDVTSYVVTFERGPYISSVMATLADVIRAERQSLF